LPLCETIPAPCPCRSKEVQDTRDVTIIALASLAETRDNETGAHLLGTREYVKVLAEYLRTHPGYQAELDDMAIQLLYKSAPLHDNNLSTSPGDLPIVSA
jgi:putative two-component system response regulator